GHATILPSCGGGGFVQQRPYTAQTHKLDSRIQILESDLVFDPNAHLTVLPFGPGRTKLNTILSAKTVLLPNSPYQHH
ncbi:hypothetical protein, partial [Chromobacterium violaceum]